MSTGNAESSSSRKSSDDCNENAGVNALAHHRERRSQPVTTRHGIARMTDNNACPLFSDATSSMETLTLIDANGLASNSLSATVTRPAAAP
jgi:hypothetical protein